MFIDYTSNGLDARDQSPYVYRILPGLNHAADYAIANPPYGPIILSLKLSY